MKQNLAHSIRHDIVTAPAMPILLSSLVDPALREMLKDPAAQQVAQDYINHPKIQIHLSKMSPDEGRFFFRHAVVHMTKIQKAQEALANNK